MNDKAISGLILILIMVFSFVPLGDEITAIADHENATTFQQFLPVVFNPSYILILIFTAYKVITWALR